MWIEPRVAGHGAPTNISCAGVPGFDARQTEEVYQTLGQQHIVKRVLNVDLTNIETLAFLHHHRAERGPRA